jgi:hypothetical protein
MANPVSMTLYLRGALLVTFSILYTDVAPADVVDSSSHGFTVKSMINVPVTPDEAYRHLLDVGKWWDPSHTFWGNSQNLSIEGTANGCFCEKLEGGGSVRHLVVVLVDPGKTLRLAGALGPLQSMAVTGTLTWSLSEGQSGTQVAVVYSVGGYRPTGLLGLGHAVDKVLLNQLLRLKSYIEKGNPAANSQEEK